jgi:hypothetical protein
VVLRRKHDSASSRARKRNSCFARKVMKKAASGLANCCPVGQSLSGVGRAKTEVGHCFQRGLAQQQKRLSVTRARAKTMALVKEVDKKPRVLGGRA